MSNRPGAFGLRLFCFLLASATGLSALAAGVTVVPDTFLRSYEPITFFFATDQSVEPGPEDDPQRLVVMNPEHPGAYQWLDRRTLQFRPADPWPALSPIELRVGDFSAVLYALLDPPESSTPEAGAEDLPDVSWAVLSFAAPVDAEKLQQAFTLEASPLPGGSGPSWVLTGADANLKILERSQTKATVRLRFQLPQGEALPLYEFSFATAAPFTISQVSCGSQAYPVPREGVPLSPKQALTCDSYSPTVLVRFSQAPANPSISIARSLVRFTPAVENLDFAFQERQWTKSGNFKPHQTYRLDLLPTDLRDGRGVALDLRAASRFYLYFPPKPSFLTLSRGEATLELFGPKMVPIRG